MSLGICIIIIYDIFSDDVYEICKMKLSKSVVTILFSDQVIFTILYISFHEPP